MWCIQRFGLIISTVAAIGLAACAAQSASCPRDADHVAILSATGEHCFRVDIADTPEKRSRGLMHVRHMDEDRGMLFVFDWVNRQTFWMKDTYISLDIIFIAPDGQIANIEERTKPLSEEAILSTGAVSAVLEINGGLSERLGLKTGDSVRHPGIRGRSQ